MPEGDGLTTGSTAFLGPAGLLSERAKEISAQTGGADRFWSAISSLFVSKEKLVVKQAKITKGWDRLDYRADEFEPFCFIGNHAVYLRFGKGKIEYVLLIDDQPVNIYNYFPPRYKTSLHPSVALLVRFYIAATQDDYIVQRDEEIVLLTLRKALAANKDMMDVVKSQVMEHVLWHMMDDLRLDAEEKAITKKLGNYLQISKKETTLATQNAVLARAAVLVKSKGITAEAIEKWSAMARAEGVHKNRVISTVQRLKRACFAQGCCLGDLPRVHSSTAPLHRGEILHFASRSRVFKPQRGRERLVVRTINSGRDPVLSMMFESEPVAGRERLEQVDSGSFYLTSKRMILVGRKRSWSCKYRAMKNVRRYRKGVRIDGSGPTGFRYYEIDGADEAYAIILALWEAQDN